ncbi:16S rRNA (uracil(1498)-N(3))-methyltransferase [Erythrobacter litoralis]|uniref:16S rRNA (uracil(1498)-N(3))-methyltransferase n=1 Tax=Erythrobacter litoralis TaxID=39960 RepID=UPI0024358300|nr:16S rRNA (uracil(1498)-N(3))-methyltransferase [Erythrobacter litoralis]MDG6080300.1 16S rRNA (uracil(1498)-N(3))-methyltransferase [Erythrobacter litoralis]
MAATPSWPPRSAPRLFVDEPLDTASAVRIEGNQAHYLTKVMRIGPSSVVMLCDDRTGEWSAIVSEIGKRYVTLEPMSRLREREEVPDFWLCPALLKKDRFDTVLEKATELGVGRIAPVLTRRCVADKLNAERAKTIVIEAAEQCARTALPAVDAPVALDRLLAEWPQSRTLFFADEQGGRSAADAFAERKGASALLIGPEGGFDDAERAAIRAHPRARPISLGPRILRGETAAIAATALWMGIAGDWAGDAEGS